jgi:hypothetical protein
MKINPDQISRIFAADQNGAANNHLRITELTTGQFVDIYLPTGTIDLLSIPQVLPATQLSGIGVAAILNNIGMGAFLNTFINHFANIIGLTFIITFEAVTATGINQFQFLCDGPYKLQFDVPDSIGHLLGFGKLEYLGTDSSANYVVRSPKYISEYSTFIPLLHEKTIHIISDLVFGSDSGMMQLNEIADNAGILFIIPWWATDETKLASFRNMFESPIITPFINIEHSEFAKTIKNGQQANMRFWVKWPSGIPIDNLANNGWSMRLSITYLEADSAIMHII